jgi:hypothetical protein
MLAPAALIAALAALPILASAHLAACGARVHAHLRPKTGVLRQRAASTDTLSRVRLPQTGPFRLAPRKPNEPNPLRRRWMA